MMTGKDSAIADWLTECGLIDYAATFAEHAIDLDALSELNYEHLREMGLPIGACLRIQKALAERARRASPAAPAADEQIVEMLEQVVTERRQVTAMFCDIVGSTKLARDRDPEEMRQILVNYWAIVEATAAEHAGYIAQHLGDGALIYFGFPAAQENDAERAVLAGLALLQAIAKAPSAGMDQLQVRIGLSTGTVVINQFKGKAGKIETLAIGQSVNFASRLQSVARPGSLVIDDSTHALVAGLFTFEDIGSIELDGFDEPTPLYKVNSARRVRSRFEAREYAARTSLRGRSDVMSQAHLRWEDCCLSRGQVVLISGEPGIGKSRLAQELMTEFGPLAAHQVVLQCSAQNSSSPLFPVIESLSILADTPALDQDPALANRLSAVLATTAANEALLLGLFEQGTAPAPSNPQQHRNATLQALVDLFAARCATGPLLFVIEDLHLSDPTTLEFLDRLVARGRTLPLFVLATTRPEFDHDFGEGHPITRLPLSRLQRDDTDHLVREILEVDTASRSLLEIVSERSDGVPLFVEELLKSLMEVGAILKSGQHADLKDGIDGGAIPRSLQSTLTARLDKLRATKRIAQIAACIGREFSVDLLARVTGLTEPELRMQLEEIASRDLIIRTEHMAKGDYRFRHALVSDAAYGSLLFSERKAIHGQIAEALMAQSSPARPEILAHHLTGAHRAILAIEKWREAGEAAKLRSADAEAVLHLNRALALVENLPEQDTKDELELAVLLSLIAPLRATRGFAAADVAELTNRCIALADKARDARRILNLLYNRWVYSFVTSHRSQCEKLARDILDRSALDTTNLLRMTGLRAVAATQFTAGEFVAAAANFDASVAAYDVVRQADMIHAVGLDGKVTALGYCALTRWCLGQPILAHAHARTAIEVANALDHISTRIFAIYHEALLAGVLERNAAVLRRNGRDLQTIGQDHGFAMWLICGKLLESLAACLEASSAANLTVAEGYFADFADMGVVYRPTYHAFLAETSIRAGKRDRAHSHIEAAKSMITMSGERWNEPDLLRIEASLCPDAAAARAIYDKGMHLAILQGAIAWQTRIQEGLLRLHGAQLG